MCAMKPLPALVLREIWRPLGGEPAGLSNCRSLVLSSPAAYSVPAMQKVGPPLGLASAHHVAVPAPGMLLLLTPFSGSLFARIAVDSQGEDLQ